LFNSGLSIFSATARLLAGIIILISVAQTKSIIMHRATVVILALLLSFHCSVNSEKSKAEEANEDKFRHQKEKDAHFVIGVLDTSYGLLDVARMGQLRMIDPQHREQIRLLIESQTSAMVKLKTFAEKRGIVIPLSASETKGSVRRLENKGARDFNKAWVREMKDLQHRLKTDIEGYQRKSGDSALIHVLDSTLLMVKTNNEIISDLADEEG
jgi:hypothetical protein